MTLVAGTYFMSLHLGDPEKMGVAETEAKYEGYERAPVTIINDRDFLQNANHVQFLLCTADFIGFSMSGERGFPLVHCQRLRPQLSVDGRTSVWPPGTIGKEERIN